MKKTVSGLGLTGIFALALVGVWGCDKTPAAAGGEGGAVAVAADPGDLSVGKEIVASGSANSFTGGTVTAIEGMKVTYEYGEADKTTKKRYSSSVDKSKAFVLGVAAKTEPKVGDFVIAKSASGSWNGCEVKSVTGTVLACEDWYGKSNNVEAKGVVVPDGATAADIKTSLAEATTERVFSEAAKAAGKPSVPAGWKPKVGDSVAVEWMAGSWYAASVLKVDGDTINIKYDTKGWPDPKDKNLSALAPKPTGKASVKVDQFVLVHVGDEWPYHKVLSVTKTSAEVADKKGKKTTVNLTDIIPVGH